MNRLIACLIFATLAACTAEVPDPTISKEEARLMGGKSDTGADLCALLDWYGDGICDDFCLEPDPDCGDCPEFVTVKQSCFTFEAWECPAGTEHFVDPDACGCGCVAVEPPPICPAATEVEYHSCFTFDAWECPAGSEQVIDPDGCGCYCQPAECPSETEAEYHSCFTFDAWECPAGSEQVIDPDGCGCYCTGS